jgi:hypothetical protein
MIPAGGMAGLAMPGTPSLRLPGEHFAAALLFLTTAAAGLIWVAPELASGTYLSPHVEGVTHCVTLGWLTLTIFGALYQLLPVALGVPVRSERFGHVSFWTFAPGVALLVIGIAFSSIAMRRIGIALITFGIVCLVTNVGLSLRRVAKRDVIWAAVAVGLGYLTMTLLLGSLLAENLHAGYLGNWRVTVLATHLHVALLGFVLVTMIGISHRLLPMFLLAHTADTRWTRRALVMVATGVFILASGLALLRGTYSEVARWIGLICIEIGVAFFLTQARQFYKHRKRPRLDAGLRHAAVALVFLGITACIAPFVLLLGGSHPRLATEYVVLGVLGGFAMYVVGQFYKIVPFLAWIARFRKDVGVKPVPTVAQMFSSRVGHIDLVLLVTGILGIEIGIAMANATVTRLAACSVLAGVLCFASQMIRVVYGNPPIPIPDTRS